MTDKNKIYGAGFRTLRPSQSLRLRRGATNKRVPGSGFQPYPKSPPATSDTRQTLYEMAGKKQWLISD